MPKQYGAIEQNQLIEKAKKKSLPLQIFLKSGVPLRGKVIAHDNHALFIVTEQGQILVYKHAISSLAAGRAPQKKR